MCGDPLSRYTCRVARVAASFLRILGFFKCSSSIALHPPLKRPCRTCRPWTARSVARQAASEKVSRYTGVAATLAGVTLHCATNPHHPPPKARRKKQNKRQNGQTMTIFVKFLLCFLFLFSWGPIRDGGILSVFFFVFLSFFFVRISKLEGFFFVFCTTAGRPQGARGQSNPWQDLCQRRSHFSTELT